MKKRCFAILSLALTASVLITGCKREAEISEVNNSFISEEEENVIPEEDESVVSEEEKTDIPDEEEIVVPEEEANTNVFAYHFADKAEAVECFLSNEEYFAGFSNYEIQYKTQDKNGTLEDVKEFGAAQMGEFPTKKRQL